jgi:hypothetical protein
VGGVNIMHSKRYIVHRQPVSSPGDYYGALMNTIDDIISIFKTREAAELYCGGREYALRITEVIWEE